MKITPPLIQQLLTNRKNVKQLTEFCFGTQSNGRRCQLKSWMRDSLPWSTENIIVWSVLDNACYDFGNFIRKSVLENFNHAQEISTNSNTLTKWKNTENNNRGNYSKKSQLLKCKIKRRKKATKWYFHFDDIEVGKNTKENVKKQREWKIVEENKFFYPNRQKNKEQRNKKSKHQKNLSSLWFNPIKSFQGFFFPFPHQSMREKMFKIDFEWKEK